MLNTLRHESSHALAVYLQGGKVVEFIFWPSWHVNGYGLALGYVRWEGQLFWPSILAAPYLCDLFTIMISIVALILFQFHHRPLFINLVIIGLIFPFINTFYNYAGSFFRKNDINALRKALPSPIVDSALILMMVLIIIILFEIRNWISDPVVPSSQRS